MTSKDSNLTLCTYYHSCLSFFSFSAKNILTEFINSLFVCMFELKWVEIQASFSFSSISAGLANHFPPLFMSPTPTLYQFILLIYYKFSVFHGCSIFLISIGYFFQVCTTLLLQYKHASSCRRLTRKSTEKREVCCTHVQVQFFVLFPCSAYEDIMAPHLTALECTVLSLEVKTFRFCPPN